MIFAQQIGGDLIKALGLPKMTRSFSLHARVGEPVTVSCEHYLADSSFVPVLANYRLVERASPQQVEPLDFDVWMRAQNEQAHRCYMERTKCLPPYTREQIEQFYDVRSHGGID